MNFLLISRKFRGPGRNEPRSGPFGAGKKVNKGKEDESASKTPGAFLVTFLAIQKSNSSLGEEKNAIAGRQEIVHILIT